MRRSFEETLGPFGTFTARKERAGNQRGDWNWRAYRKRGGKLYRAYLGHSAALMGTHLHAVAAKLTAQHEEARGEPVPDSHEASPLPHVLSERSPVPERLCLLPVRLTSFVGREQEIASISDLLLRDDVRLLTLTGPGGVGKTRVALAVAARAQEHFRAEVCFVSLAPITEDELVLPIVAQTLGVKATRTQSKESVKRSCCWDGSTCTREKKNLHGRYSPKVCNSFRQAIIPAA